MSVAPEETTEDRTARYPVDTGARTAALGASLMLLLAIGGVAFSVMPVVADQLRSGVGLSDSQIGLLTSVFMVAFGGAAIPWGLAAARWGGRVFGLGFGVAVVGSIVCAFSSGFAGLMAGRLIQGAGLGVMVTTTGVIIPAAVSPRLRGRVWGILGTGHGVGVMVALLALPSIAEAGGYRAVFLVTAALTAVVAAVVLAQRPVRRKPVRDAATMTTGNVARCLGTALRNRQVLLLCLFNLAALAVSIGVLVWTPEFLKSEFKASASVSAYLTAGLGLAQLVGNPLGAAAMGRWSKRRVIVASMLLMAACTALVPFLPALALVFVFVTVTGFLTMAYFPPLFAGAAEVVSSPGELGAATGLLEVFGFTGALIAPWLFGVLLDGLGAHTGYMAGYLLLAGIAAASCVGLAFLRLPAGRGDEHAV